ncbi:hypothetical protein AB0K09_20595 [Streptomyces sp. NPDC049577]|uniref:hypothetical protein n=1 Tax=Streptomyces sp. NPDC049577 TaxID=3155153 RepID=UPI00341F280B
MPAQPITDIRAACAQRLFPTVTVWNRVEGRPRTTEFGRALRAEVRDALWMLSRQWQLGEFQGQDAGSPVSATYHLSTASLNRLRPGEADAVDLPDGMPVEPVAEHRAVPFVIGTDPVSYDLRLALAHRWFKLLSTVVPPVPTSLRRAYLDLYPIRRPDPNADADTQLVAHPGVWATLQAVAGRAIDGYSLFRHVKDGGNASDGVTVLVPGHKEKIDAAGRRLVAWFDDLLSQPSGPTAWDPGRLEHIFSATAGERELTAQEYPGGRLDWYTFSAAPRTAVPRTVPQTPAAHDGAATGSVTRTVFPGTTRFPGMPLPRWWALEDGNANFSAVTPDTTDLVRLLFLEFALVFSNDWFLLPCDLPVGTLAALDGLAVTDVFGQRLWVTPAGSGSDETWQRWAMYELDVAGTGPAPADTSLFLPPNTVGSVEGPPLEEVLFIRDENADMVWGIERTVPLATGEGRRGSEAAAETLAHRRRLLPPPAPATPVAPVAYRAMSTVPENWIPFVPVHVPGDNRRIQLQRAALPRFLDGGATTPTAKVRPRTTLLRPGLDGTPAAPYFVHQEEVPRAGTALTLAYHRTRLSDGRVVVWLGARRTTGRGEGSSGLAFDRLVDA